MLLRLTVIGIVLGAVALAQTDRGTLTGVIADPAGAVVANAALELRACSPTFSNRFTASTSPMRQIAPFLRPRSGNPPQGASKTGSLPRIPDHV